jgi:rare lipoprotein A
MLRFIFSASLAFGALAPLAAEAASSCGIASWYGPGFHGNLTASGERFNSQALTAAHRSLPFGTKIKVTNQDNGRSVIVRGNDRGPFYGSRIIDLSEAAFARIASTSQGLASVCISKL